QSCVIGASLYLAYVVAYAVGDARRFALLIAWNLAACIAMFVTLALSGRRRTRLARVALLATLNPHIFRCCWSGSTNDLKSSSSMFCLRRFAHGSSRVKSLSPTGSRV